MSCLSAVGGRDAAHRQRPEAARIARCENAVGTDHHQRKRAFNPPQRIGHRLRQRVLARERDQVQDDFGVAVGLEDRSLTLQPARNLQRIHEVAVVRNGDHPLLDCTKIGCAFSSAESPAVE